jgi:hypothetical protein
MRYKTLFSTGLLALLTSCGSPSDNAAPPAPTAASLAGLTCEQLTARALKTIDDAMASVVQCSTSSDCKPIVVAGDCWPSCQTGSLAGNDDAKAAVAAKAGDIAEVCAQFHQRDCKITEPGCPAPGTHECVQGICKLQ